MKATMHQFIHNIIIDQVIFRKRGWWGSSEKLKGDLKVETQWRTTKITKDATQMEKDEKNEVGMELQV